MTIENSEDATQPGVTDLAEQPAAKRPSGPVDSEPAVTPRVPSYSAPALDLSVAGTAHDSSPPLSRKLAPPPKPKRDSGAASGAPSPLPPADGVDLRASSSALKAPLTPNFSYPPAFAAASAPGLPSSPPADPGTSRPTMRSSSPALGFEERDRGSSSAPRAFSSPPRPQSEPPPASLAPPSASAPPPGPAASDAPARPSAIFAMRIIAVGESVRPPPVQESSSEPDPRTFPSSPARLGTSERRSSRPVLNAAASSSALEALQPSSAQPVEDAPSIEVKSLDLDLPIDVELPAELVKRPAPPEPRAAAPSFAPLSSSVVLPAFPPPPAAPEPAAATEAVEAPPAPVTEAVVSDVPSEPPPVAAPASEVTPAVELDLPASAPAAPEPEAADPVAVEPARTRAPSLELTEELTDADVAPLSSERTVAAIEPDELGREEAISMPPEEVAALLRADAQIKADAAKPPPPPKRAPGTPSSGPPSLAAAAPALAAPAVAKEPPPTPDLAAAKAAQRAKTRLPWWEDLFNEDFMRASARVSDEQIRREVTFIEDSLGVAAGGVVLDLGCGSGQHAVEFASRGYGVVGYDLSTYQLSMASEFAQERSQKINFLHGDMREMAFEETFDGVFCWNTTFGYFEEDKNLAVAQRVFRALRPGGMFLIDVLNRDFAAASSPCTVWYEGDACVCMDDMSVDFISSRLRVKRSIILDDGRTKESLFSLRLYSLHELGKLLHDVGFKVTEASGHPGTPGVFFGPNSPRIIMLAQRP